jgi:N-acetylglucosamine kinase-like BadF-type ATPase
MEDMSTDRYILGIDGGGTKTTAILSALDGNIVTQADSGPANIQINGPEKSAKLIISLVIDCCKKGKCEISSLKSIVLGLAGAGRAIDKTNFLDELQAAAKKNKIQLPPIVIETDARIALEAAFASSFGIALIAGTGSIALGKGEDAKIYRAGGWGRILGDEGGGYVIGRQALNLAIRSQEGRSGKTVLLKLAFEHFQASSIDELVTKIYREGADVASFAPKVFQAEMEFDHVAHSVLFSQASELAELVRVLVAQMHPKRKLPVALMGGLLEEENIYSRMVKERIARSLPQIVIQKPKFPTAFGSVIIGLKAFES